MRLSLATSSSRGGPARPRKAYSLIEMLITVLIIQIISGMIMVNVSTVQTTEKLTRASEQIIVALRFARLTAMSTGAQSGVEFDTSANTMRAFTTTTSLVNGVPTTTYPTLTNRVIPGGTYSINLKTQAETNGVTITELDYLTDSTNPYQVTYGTLGSLTDCVSGLDHAEIVVSYGGLTRKIRIPIVGEPYIDLQ